MELRNFLEQIFGEAEGFVTLVLPDEAGKPGDSHWYKYPKQIDSMARAAKSYEDGDVWFSPYIYSEPKRSLETSKSAHVLGADADTAPPEAFRLAPTVTIQTRPGRYQLYWFLDEQVASDKLAKINRRIAQVHKDDGCDTAYVNAAKLMRVPFTSNMKQPGQIVTILSDNGPTYALETFEDTYPESEVPDTQHIETQEFNVDIEAFVKKEGNQLANRLPYDQTLVELIYSDPVDGKRSEARFKLLCELYMLGLPDQEILAIAWIAKSNKYNEDARGVRGLWDELVRAKATVDEEQQRIFHEPIGSGDEKPKRKKKARERVSFLTEEERAVLEENFIDKWVAWAATKTDAPSEFHRAAAMTLLSIVYSEFGHATPTWGALRLNLWFMVMGRTTKDRKSTSRSFLQRALRALRHEKQYEGDTEYDYELGDDVTPGGISLALHDRANMASLFDRDEVQGLFKEVLSQGYMAGGLEVFTKLYDGWSGGRLRASGDKKKLPSVPVSFVMFLMGILEETTQVLTVTNYKSGFLTRFLYTIGERPEGYVSPPIEQAPEFGGDEEDIEFNHLMNHLRAARNFWNLNQPEARTEGRTFGVRVEDEAWERFQKFEADLNKKAEGHLKADIIGPTLERAKISVLKLAVILAMDDRCKRVTMKHMLTAIGYAGEWYDNAALVATMVAASEWEREVDALENFIRSKGGRVSFGVAYTAFKSKTSREFEDMVSSLAARGVIEKQRHGSKFILVMREED